MQGTGAGPVPPGGIGGPLATLAKPPFSAFAAGGHPATGYSVLPALQPVRAEYQKVVRAWARSAPFMRTPHPALARVPRAASAPARRARCRCRGADPAQSAQVGTGPQGVPPAFSLGLRARLRAPRRSLPSQSLSSPSTPLRAPYSVALAPFRLGRFLARVAGSPLPCPLRGFGPGSSSPGAAAAKAAFFLPLPPGNSARVLSPAALIALSGCCVSCKGFWCR